MKQRVQTDTEYSDTHMGSIVKAGLAAKLLEILAECAKPNWDSYNAPPVKQEVIERAAAFIHAMPAYLPKPEIVPDADGEIQFEWDNSTKEITALIEIAIDAKGRLAWAGTYERERDKGNVDGWWHGEDQFDGVIPQHIIDKVMRVMGETNPNEAKDKA